MGSSKKITTVRFSALCGDAGPDITSARGATVKELTDNAPGENTFLHVKSGAVKFRDSAGDHHTASVKPAGTGYIGTFKLGAVNQSQDSVPWTFKISDGVLDSMQAGQTIIQKYFVTVKDAAGHTDISTVTVKIVGTNDVPVVILDPAKEGADVEGFIFPQFSEGPLVLSDGDSFQFDDVDLLDSHILSIVPSASNTAGGTLTAIITDPATGAGTGTIAWQYQIDNSAVFALSGTATETFDIHIDDQHGGVAIQQITIHIFAPDAIG